MEKTELIQLFKKANHSFLTRDQDLILNNVNERTLCGALAVCLNSVFSKSQFKKYFVDVEYNRNDGKVKTIIDNNYKVVSINCDIIVHSRGTIIKKDNLIAIEMKKSNAPHIEKLNDKIRLIALTKDSYDDIWSNDGRNYPEHVCGYSLGIYYEIKTSKTNILLEYYTQGKFFYSETINI